MICLPEVINGKKESCQARRESTNRTIGRVGSRSYQMQWLYEHASDDLVRLIKTEACDGTAKGGNCPVGPFRRSLIAFRSRHACVVTHFDFLRLQFALACDRLEFVAGLL